jgi:hypothetical protein
MSTRKTKPTFSSLIELPSERLQLKIITVEHEAPTSDAQRWQATALAATRMPPRRKVILH